MEESEIPVIAPSFSHEIYHFPAVVSVLIIGVMKQILVVGAGPAGSACAWRLSVEGIPCILADRSSFPRPKVCGGVLSHRAIRFLCETGMLSQLEIEDLTVQIHSTMTISSDFRELRTFTEGVPPVRLVNRTEFDGFLRRRAIEEGALPLNDNFMDISGNTALFKSGRHISFRRIVGADGAASRVRRAMKGWSFRRPCPAFSAIVPLSETAIIPFNDRGLHVFFFKDFTGYGWLFPRKEDIVAGIGSFRGKGRTAERLMSQLMVHTGLGTSHLVSGALLPAGRQTVFPGHGSVLLAGDAAGLCDRVSGEGISHALESGFAAAEAIIENRETWGAGTRCIDIVKQSAKYMRLLYGKPFRSLAVRALAGSDRWYRKYWEIVSGKEDYRRLMKS